MKVYRNTRESVVELARALIQDEEKFISRMKPLDSPTMVTYSEGKIAAWKLLLSDLEEKV